MDYILRMNTDSILTFQLLEKLTKMENVDIFETTATTIFLKFDQIVPHRSTPI